MQTAPSAASVSRDRDSLLVDLALQGGGAHGTYTWGVLDRLLEQPWLRIDGISGTSAGAMNAAALVYGHSLGGNDGARTVLETVWRRVSEAGLFSAAHLYIFIRKAVDQSGISAVVTGVSMCPKLSTDPS